MTQHTIDSLTKKIEEKNKVIDKLRVKQAKLDAVFQKELDQLRSLSHKRDTLLLSLKKDKNKIDFDIVLEADPSEVMYEEQRRQLEMLGLNRIGYNPKTNQTFIHIALYNRRDKKYQNKNTKTYKSLITLLPHIKSMEDGYKLIGISEHTCSEHGVYQLKIKGDTPYSDCTISKTTYGREYEVITFNGQNGSNENNLKKAFNYIKDNLYCDWG